MNKLKPGNSPTLIAEITSETYKTAVQAESGACLAADAIEERYPQYKADVDVATTTIKDPKRGLKFIYLTPQKIGNLLVGFDQGWLEKELPIKLRIANAIKIVRMTRSRSDQKMSAEKRAARLAELEAKEKSGEKLTPLEKRSLKKMRDTNKKSVERPTNPGPSEIVTTTDGREVVVGGKPIKKPKNPNLLRGRNRIFGAKTATPAKVFQTALEHEKKKFIEEYKAAQSQQKLDLPDES
jgi:hypothetical protein